MSNGGSAIDFYNCVAFSAATGGSIVSAAGGGAAGCTLTGLTQGTTYYFAVRAHSAVGYGSWSDPRVAFTLVPPAAVVSSISPNSGTYVGGTAVTIAGSGFVAGATVSIGGVAASGVSVVSSTSITATTGAHAAGPVDVVVANPTGTPATLVGGFTYTATPGVPTDVQVAMSGLTAVRVTFTPPVVEGGSAIDFYNCVAFSAATGGSIVSAAGGGAAGCTLTGLTQGTTYYFAVRAHSAVGYGSWSDPRVAFTLVPPAAVVSSISPNSGTYVGGTAVTIAGSGFVAGATVSIGGVAASGVSVVSSTSITATTGAHAAGPVDVVVANPTGSPATLVGGFTYTATPGVPTDVQVAMSGLTAVRVTFTPPVSNGGPAIDFYNCVAFSAATGGSIVSAAGGGAAGCTLTGLTQGTTYFFAVRAHNSVGYGDWSAPRVSFLFQ